MKYLKQFGIILLFSFIGELLNHFIPLPIPASIYGIVILFLCLNFKIISLDTVKDIGKFLVEIMPVMFIPAAAGLLNSWDVIKPSLGYYLVITVVSTIVVMAAAGKVTQAVIEHNNKNTFKKAATNIREQSNSSTTEQAVKNHE